MCWPSHAAMREDQIAPGRGGERGSSTDVSGDPRSQRRWRWPRPKLDAGELLAAARSSRPTASASGFRSRARHFDPVWRGALPDRDGAQRCAEGARETRKLDPRAQDFTSSHPATPERVANAQTHRAAILRQPEQFERARARETYLRQRSTDIDLWRGSQRRLRARPAIPASEARLHLHRAREGFVLENTAAGGVRRASDGGSQALRFDVVRVPAEQTLGRLSEFGLDREGVDEIVGRGGQLSMVCRPLRPPRQGRRSGSSRLYALRFGSEVYRFIFAAKQTSRTETRAQCARERRDSFRRHDARCRGAAPRGRCASRS
jgi:predicted Zn-dependent protease